MTTYKGTTVDDLAGICAGVFCDVVQGRVEAENVEEVWRLVKRWFDIMQAGEAQNMLPDPFWQPKPGRRAISPEVADHLVSEIDEDFSNERARYIKGSDGVARGPEFLRLPPHARLAFAQQVWDVMMTGAEIEAEAVKRWTRGS